MGMLYKTWVNTYPLSRQLIDKYNFYVELAVILFNVYVILLCLAKIKIYEKTKKENVINLSTKWIVYSLYGGGVLIPIWIYITIYHQNIWRFYYPLWIGISALVFFIGNKAIIELRTYNERQKIRIKKQSLQPKINSIGKTGVSGSKKTFEKIKNEIIDRKLYLNPNITLSSVAELFNISSGYLSQLIGSYSEYSFNSLINALRIEEAKNLLLNPEFNKYTTAAIGLESGFNSKSTFFAEFKKHTGTSPANFKLKKALQNN
ncbi:helix-turn-helix transcriptional regulator [uncultured Croceitalea sp.]|uniref:helix-turn-helix domain-containing protein n=1 Tax=uncultured Croceitalea sp. TaxID=1798908 RepID=UPI0033058F21